MDNQFKQTSIENQMASREIVNQFNGAWEVWYQVQFALYLLLKDPSDSYTFQREVAFPGSRKTCDFVVYPQREPDFTFWLELKVMLQTGPHDLVRRFLGDVQKLLDSGIGPDNNTAGAVAVVPELGQDFLADLQNNLPPGEGGEYFYWVYNARSPVGLKGNLSNDIPYIDPSNSVFAYRKVI